MYFSHLVKKYSDAILPGKKAVRFFKASLLTCIFSVAFAASIYAAPNIDVIKGVVTDENGARLPGVLIYVRVDGKTLAPVISKNDGSFELHNVPEGATIRVTSMGYSVVEIKVKAGQSELRVKMNSTVNVLNDVTVNTGLYRRPIGSFTGASSTMTGEELKLVSPGSVIKGISALDPSFRIVENNAMGSNPNSLPVIQLRGQNNLPISTQSLSSASNLSTDIQAQQSAVTSGDLMSSYISNPNQPLIIIDGFQSTLQKLYDMDINRIERITLLKDAAASVAYGSKAANGVVVVETKRPTGGRIQVSYAMNINTQLADLSSYHLLDAGQLLEAQRLSGVYNDANYSNDLGLKQWYDYRKYQVQSGVNSYWLAKPLQTGLGTNQSLTLNGGSSAVRFSMTASYNKTSGVMIGSDRNAYGIVGDISYSKGRFRFSNSMSLNYGRSNNSVWGTFSQYAGQFPYFRPYDSTGAITKIFEPTALSLGIPVGAPGGTFTNAMYNSTLQVKDYSDYLSFSDMLTGEWIISPNLRITGGLNMVNQLPSAEKYLPADHTSFAGNAAALQSVADLGSYTQTTGRNSSIDGRISMDYNKHIGYHTVYFSMGSSLQQTESKSTTVQVFGIPNNNLGQLGMANGYASGTKPLSSLNNTRSLSLYSSLSYNYRERYVGEVTVNASGSSQFGSNNRIAPFFAYGAGWNIDKESFFGKPKAIQQLRIRASYGVTGNQNFAATLAQPTYLYNLQNNYRLQLGSYLQGYANPNLKWQQTRKTNVNLTMSLFDSRLNLNINGYVENTDNLILPIGVEPSTGFVAYQDNLGATQNKGYEVSVSAQVYRNKEKNILWTITFNTGHNSNTIKSLSPAIELLNKSNDASSISQQVPLPRYTVGQSMSQLWAVKSLGIDPATGNEMYEKLNGSKTFIWNPADKRPVGDGLSQYKGTFGSNFTYKGFVFNILIGYEAGGQIYNQTLVDKVENVNLKLFNADERVLTDRWQKPGDQALYKSIAISNELTNATSRFVQNNDYINASSLTLGYTFPANLGWVRRLHLSTPRLFITQNDVFRIGTVKLERGTGYPFSRSFSLGLATSF